MRNANNMEKSFFTSYVFNEYISLILNRLIQLNPIVRMICIIQCENTNQLALNPMYYYTIPDVIPTVHIKQSKLFYTFTVVNADCSEAKIPSIGTNK